MDYNIISGNKGLYWSDIGNEFRWITADMHPHENYHKFIYEFAKTVLQELYEIAVEKNHHYNDPIWTATIEPIIIPLRGPPIRFDDFMMQPMTAPTGQIFTLRQRFPDPELPRNITTAAQAIGRGMRVAYDNTFTEEYPAIFNRGPNPCAEIPIPTPQGWVEADGRPLHREAIQNLRRVLGRNPFEPEN